MGRANWWFPGQLDRAIPSFLSEVQVATAVELDDARPA